MTTHAYLFLLSVQDNSAIMMAKHASYSLQLIVTFIKPKANIPLSDLEGAQHAQINLQTFQLIVTSHYSKTFLHFSKGFTIFCEGDRENVNNGNNTEDNEAIVWQKLNLPSLLSLASAISNQAALEALVELDTLAATASFG
jgi:hypothetical protein